MTALAAAAITAPAAYLAWRHPRAALAYTGFLALVILATGVTVYVVAMHPWEA